jgi:VIT1/CCC1 family predicted Fe2+/Mn2+ transporter
MSGWITHAVLPLAVRVIGGFAGRLCTGRNCCLVVRVDVLDADHDRLRDAVLGGWRASPVRGVRDDHRAAAGAELGSVFADLDAFGEPEDPGQPLDGRADIVVCKDRQDPVRRNRGIASSHDDIVFRSDPACNIRRAVGERRNRRPVADRSTRHPQRVRVTGTASAFVGSSASRVPRPNSCSNGRVNAGPPEWESDARNHPGERHGAGFGSRLNWLRAGVLGANDGIVSVAGLVVGVAGVTTDRGPLFTAGIAGLVAGAVSMALGEYVSVSSQRDSEKAQLATEKRELREDPELELAELTALYEAKGLRPETARTVARELTEHDALAAHLDAELSIDPEDLTSPWQAAGASALAFTLGAVLPLLAILLPPPAWRVPACVAVVLVTLAVAGWVGAVLGGGHRTVAVARVVIGGGLGLAITYLIGHLFGTAIG